MSCTYCTPTKPVIGCTTSLVIGTIEAVSTNVYVYLYNVASNKTSRYTAVSSVAGLVTITIAQGLSTNQDYQVWITLQTATNPDEKLTITVEDTEHECLIANFDRIYTSTNLVATAVTQTLSL